MAVGDTYTLDEKQGKALNRIDTKTNWEAVNPVLAIGEMGIEKDGLLQNIKVGDGVTPWNSLQYMFKSCPYEIGDILVTMNATDPAVRWPGTTWEVFAPGRVLIGAGKGTDINGTSMEFAVGATGGEYSHQLTVGEMPSHSHSASSSSTGDHYHVWYSGRYGSSENSTSADSAGVGANNTSHKTLSAGSHSHTITINNTGSNTAHNNIQPYLAVYYWKRTA